MTHPKSLAQLVLNALLICVMLIQPITTSPLRAASLTAQAESAAQTDSAALTDSTKPAVLLPRVETARSPLADVLQKQVMTQAARVEPAPVAVETPLPPGTVGVTVQGLYQVYLPLTLKGAQSTPQDIALHPDGWMEVTQDWLIQSFSDPQGKDSGIIVRYPASYNKVVQANRIHFIAPNNQIVVATEYAEGLESLADIKPHADILQYEQKGYQVNRVTLKGLPAWQIIPVVKSEDFCQKVIVALPRMWVHFQLVSGNNEESTCLNAYEFELMLSSIQMFIGTEVAYQESEQDNTVQYINEILGMNYNRQAAYNYCNQWWATCNNSDGYCAPGGDGMHFISHALCAGGFPIHWCANPQQGHSDSRVINTVANRDYVKGFPDVYSTSAGNMQVGDIVYIGKGTTCWGWGGMVTSMQSGLPYITTHSNSYWNSRYDLFTSQCGSPASYDLVHIDTSAAPKLNSGLNLNPSTQQTGANVAASFNVYNAGGQSINLSLRVTTNGGGDFATTSCTLPVGGNCGYSESRSFASTGSYNTCAQMNTGSGWQNIPATGSGVTCRTFNIVPPADVRLSSSLSLTPNQLPYTGGTVRAQFTVQNYGGVAATERFRARVTSGPVTFVETGDITLNPGTTYNYDNTRTFSQVGLYEVIADHYMNSAWVSLIGNGSGFIRVLAPPPPPPAQNKGMPGTCGFAGEPVNTSTGNYVYDFTDLSEPTSGLVLNATRWYNALDADQVNGPFGYGTSWTYNITATLRSDKTALVRMDDGHIAYFIGEVDTEDPLNLNGVYQGQAMDTGSTLTRSGDTATLTTPDQTAYHFDAAGQLTHITHPHPAAITVSYSGTLPVQLIHSAGVTFTITYSGTLITGIASSNGRAVTYTYSTTGDLLQLTRPDGTSYTYEYDENHRLNEAHGPNGDAFVRNVYDAEGRVIRQYDQTGHESVIAYGADITGPRVFTDALGNTLTHIYDSDYRLIREVDALGYTTVYTRDAAGSVLERQEKDGAIWRYTYDERGNQLTETDPLGNTWISTYDVSNNLTSQTDPTGRTWTYEYDGQNRLNWAVDPLYHTREYIYDDQGNLIRERDEAGGETWYAYNELGLRTAITDAMGYVTRMDYDAWGNQTVYTDANGNVALFFYDALNRLERSIDPAGTVITFTYDAMGNLLAEPNEMGQMRTYTYDEHDRIVAETDFNGNVTRYGYDALGRRVVITDALGFTTVYTYNAVGSLIAEQDKSGAVRQFEYDPMGRLVREIDPLGRVTEYVHDTAGRQIETRRPCATADAACVDGFAVSRTVYDAAGRIIEERDPRGAVTRYTHDAVGRVAVITDTYGYASTTSYDPAGRVIQETDQLGAITTYEYDLLGQVITTTDALGFQTFNIYDAVGRAIQTVNARGYTTTFVYDANDRVSETWDAQGNVVRYTYDDKGQLLSVTDALSRTTTYTYDANGNRLTETNPRGHTTTYVYDALNRVIEVIEPVGCCGAGIRFTVYDAAGHMIQEIDALGFTRVYTYDVVGRKVAESTPLGYTTVYTYDAADNLIARQEPNDAIWQFGYDANGNQIRRVDPLGQVWQTDYDLLNRIMQETDPLGAVTTFSYDAAGQRITYTDLRDAVTFYVYDLLGRQVQETSPLGYTQVYTYDAMGNVVAEQDHRGFITTYIFDALDREIAQTDPLGHTWYTLYDAAGQVMAETDYNGNTTQHAYDATGNRIEVTDALRHTTTTVYDERNRIVAITDPLSRTVRMAYDEAGRVISETLPSGATTGYAYDADGREIAFTDPLGYIWQTVYDAAGRPIRESDPLGRSQVTVYDALGRAVAITDALSRTTQYVYDPLGRLITVIGPESTTQSYTYDPSGNILTERDGNGNITRYEYDREGRPIRKTNALGKTWRYRYDHAGNLLVTMMPSGAEIVYAYDALGRLIAKTYNGIAIVAFDYDANGNRTVMTDTLGTTVYVYDALNRLRGSTDADGRTVQYAYDAAGQRIRLTYPDTSVASYTYDANGNLEQITAPDGGVTTYERDALGREQHVIQANGVVVESTYDPVGNLLILTQRDAEGGVFAQHVYEVDAVNRRVQEEEVLPQGTITTVYGYDALDRLVSSVASDGIETYYAFDSAGNRTAMWGMRDHDGVLAQYRLNYAYNAANQILRAVDSATGTTTYIYDADGNRIAERTFDRWADYDYDAEGHLIAAEVKTWSGSQWSYKNGITEQYAYDGAGRRVQKDTYSAALGSLVSRREYRYDDVNHWDVLQTYNIAAAITEARYLYNEAFHKLAYWQGGESGYFQNDALGSVLGATGLGGAAPAALMRYGDYGEDLGEIGTLPTEDGYTGYERDAYTGLNYARHRYYDVVTGSFLTIDLYPGNQANLLDLHRYLYVQANPINATDPEGLFLKKAFNAAKTAVKFIVQNIILKKLVPTPRPKQPYISPKPPSVKQVARSASEAARKLFNAVIRIFRQSSDCGKKPSYVDKSPEQIYLELFDEVKRAPVVTLRDKSNVYREGIFDIVTKYTIVFDLEKCKQSGNRALCISHYVEIVIQPGLVDGLITATGEAKASIRGFCASTLELQSKVMTTGYDLENINGSVSAGLPEAVGVSIGIDGATTTENVYSHAGTNVRNVDLAYSGGGKRLIALLGVKVETTADVVFSGQQSTGKISRTESQSMSIVEIKLKPWWLP